MTCNLLVLHLEKKHRLWDCLDCNQKPDLNWLQMSRPQTNSLMGMTKASFDITWGDKSYCSGIQDDCIKVQIAKALFEYSQWRWTINLPSHFWHTVVQVLCFESTLSLFLLHCDGSCTFLFTPGRCDLCCCQVTDRSVLPSQGWAIASIRRQAVKINCSVCESNPIDGILDICNVIKVAMWGLLPSSWWALLPWTFDLLFGILTETVSDMFWWH